jgi:hypothetical protein
MSLYVNEAGRNESEGYFLGESGPVESIFDAPGEVYRFAVREYGRCTGKVYVDLPDAPATPVGWVFVKRRQYEDASETYLHETWVTLHEGPDTVVRTPHYVRIDR